MRLIRTWPREVPAGRNHVIDGVERLVVAGYDARALVDAVDDVLVLEWDIAVSREDLALFASRARRDPNSVLVAPYRLYPPNWGLAEAIWSPRRMPGNVPVEPGDAICHLFGFGMTYLPQKLLRAFADDWLTANPAGNLTDETFSGWHYRHAPEPDVPICWDVRPVHLNYVAEEVI